MSDREIITEAIRLIRDVGWSQSYDARDGHGRKCSVYSKDAVSFCLNGAIHAGAIAHLERDLPHIKYIPAFGTAEMVRRRFQTFFERMHPAGGGIVISFWQWNDQPTRTKAEVLALLEAYLLTLTTPAHLAGAGGENEEPRLEKEASLPSDVATAEGGLEPALQ